MTPPDSGEREVRDWRGEFREGMTILQSTPRAIVDELAPGLYAALHTDAVPIPPSLALRILVALEDINTQEVRAIRSELRAAVERKS